MYSVDTIVKYFTMVHQNWKENMHSLKVLFELRAYTEILELKFNFNEHTTYLCNKASKKILAVGFSYLLYYKDMQYAH